MNGELDTGLEDLNNRHIGDGHTISVQVKAKSFNSKGSL